MSTSAAAAPSGTLELVLKRDRSLVIAGLVLVAALAWTYMFYLAFAMGDMSAEMAMPQMQSWGLVDLVVMFVMWAVMMVAMMVPSAAPMLLLYAQMNRKRQEREAPYTATAFFLAGYLLVWTIFSVVATFAQWALHNATLLTPMGASTSVILGGSLLLAAGLFQLTPLKKTCLVHCRSPLHFFVSEWREGTLGALTMGARHGAYCVGCCWILMALLFVAGVMNLLWVAAITVFVLVERVLPKGDLVGRIAGVVLMAAGVAVFTVG